jgi:hypothetical protein
MQSPIIVCEWRAQDEMMTSFIDAVLGSCAHTLIAFPHTPIEHNVKALNSYLSIYICAFFYKFLFRASRSDRE